MTTNISIDEIIDEISYTVYTFQELVSTILWLFLYIIALVLIIAILIEFIKNYKKSGGLPQIKLPHIELPQIERLFGSKTEAFSISLEKSAENLKSAKTVQEIAASQINWLGNNYENVLRQSQRSFNFALIAAGISLIFFMFSTYLLNLQQSQPTSAAVTALGGALSGFVSAVNFYIYNKSTLQLAIFHNRLDLTQRYLIADSICDKLDENTKNLVRADLIRTIVGIKLQQNTIAHLENSGNTTPTSEPAS